MKSIFLLCMNLSYYAQLRHFDMVLLRQVRKCKTLKRFFCVINSSEAQTPDVLTRSHILSAEISIKYEILRNVGVVVLGELKETLEAHL